MRRGSLLADLIVAARWGQWSWVDANIESGRRSPEVLAWAAKVGSGYESDNLRKLARRLLGEEA